MQRTAYLQRIASLAVMLGVGIAITIGVGFGIASADTGAGIFAGRQLKGGTHVDGMQGGNPLTQLAESLVAGFPKPQNSAAARQLPAEWINDMFDGDTISGTPGQTVQIQTAHGTATGYTLPAPATTPSPIDVLLVAFTNFITKLLT